ncbi:MAG: protein kinase [Armatimonadetes bacterium]|nr:protein kinase [Armatimonadota bacterium]
MPDSGVAAIGEIVNARYEVLERLGEGTYFQVFKARDRVQNRMVALKLLRRHWAEQPGMAERLETEGNGVIELVHPNIARIYESGRTDTSAFLATEYVKGMTLKERLKRTGPVPLAVAVDIAIALAEALEFAHSRGIIHGDLRSHNVLITAEGQVKVTDFGVSSMVHPSGEDYSPPLRSVHYMAPEVAEGLPATPSSDIYAVGVMLYEMLTGALPFEGDTALSVALKLSKEPPPVPSRLNAGIPAALDGLILRCLQKDPSRRYRSMGALLKDLRTAQEALRFGRPLKLSGAVAGPVEEIEEEEIDDVPPIASAISTLNRVVFVIFVLGLLTVGLFAWMFLFKSNPDVRVPQLVGLSRAEALKKIEGMGLVQHLVEEWKEDTPPGQVYKQFPNPGTAVKSGADLTLWISKGEEKVRVPDVTQMRSQKAVDTLTELGLKVGDVKGEHSETMSEGRILSQDPPAGEMVAPGAKINLVKSLGPEPVVVEPPPPPVMEPTPPVTAEPTPEPTPPTPEPGATAGPTRRFEVQVDVPPGNETQQIQIEVTDDTGSFIQYAGSHKPGDSFRRIVTGSGDRVIVRVFSDGQVLSEQVMQRGGTP